MSRATLFAEAAQALKTLAAAERESEKQCERRGGLGFETPRGRRVQSSIAWTRAAEDRDRKLRQAVAAIRKAGLVDPLEMRTEESYEIGSGGHVPQ